MTALVEGPEVPAPVPTPSIKLRTWRITSEVLLIGGLYVFYSASRLLASNALDPALDRAAELVRVERLLGLHWETALNHLFADVKVIGLFASYWYATAHYIVTGAALIWLFRVGRHAYVPARRALVASTLIGLAIYLSVPTAPPRFVGGYIDILKLNAADGWWGSDASAPRGLGGLTNQLAAFPSLHAGWALWVAIVVHQHARHRTTRVLAWAHAVITAVVIVGTGNHWIVDVLFGWVVVLAGFLVADGLAASRAARRPAG